jgi:sortase A
VLVGAVAALVAASCGGGKADTAATTTTAAAASAASTADDPVFVPATNSPSTAPPTIATTTIPLKPTAAPASTTTTIPLPKPVAPPADNASEPVTLLGHIAIPKIGLSVDMFEGVTLSTFDHGPGHWPGTALPGQIGNVVIGGHRVSHSRPFRYLDRLSPGDTVLFTVNGVTSTYVVKSTEIVAPTDVAIIDQTPAKTATLFACHPPGSTSERIVVHLVYQS